MSGTPPNLTLDEEFDRYTERVDAYGLTWWTRDAGVSAAVALNPRLLPALATKARSGAIINTSDVYQQGSTWTPPRPDVHDRLLKALFPPTDETTSDPLAIYLMGLPGSGKSSVLKPLALSCIAEHERGAVVVRDADDVRVRLPEYADGLGSHVVQLEVSDITYVQAESRLSDTTHLIIDVVGDPAWVPDEMEQLRARGYTIVALCAEVPIAIAEERAKLRALSEGRHVPIGYLRGVAGRPREALDAALAISGLVTDWAVIDTDHPSAQAIVLDGSGRFGAPGRPAQVTP